MRIKFIHVALIAVLGTTAVSCQKEEIVIPQNIIAETTAKYTISYSINGVNYNALLHNDTELDVLLHQLLALARQGNTIVISDNVLSSRTIPTKEKIIYTTNNEDEAFRWAADRTKEGYTVEISFNEHTGIFTCTAVK